MSCPVPHTQREIGWLAIGALGGAILGHLANSRLKSESKCPFYPGGSAVPQQTRGEGALAEYSVVYTDRALNLMSQEFQVVMRDINRMLKQAYKAKHTAVIPGSGSYAMEAVARQIGKGMNCMVVRNGYFSYRWSDIFQRSQAPKNEIVLKAQPQQTEGDIQYAPMKVGDVVAQILKQKPEVVFAPQVETSTGIILSNEYIKAIADAVHQVGGLFVLDCIAAGTVWVDMEALGVDFIISAPQKGWTGPACCGYVMMSEAGYKKVHATESDTLAVNLKMWSVVMDQYESGSFKYWTTLPTDALRTARDMMAETIAFGLEKAQDKAWELGKKVRARFAKAGFKSVAYQGFEAPGVVVVYTPLDIRSKKMAGEFKKQGLQIAGGVPWKLGEKEGTGPGCTFRIGLFGLDKLMNVDATVEKLFQAVDSIQGA